MAKMEGTYIQVAYKNVFGYISTNSWLFFMIQRPTIREKCAWVWYNTWRDERPVATGLDRFFLFFDFSTNIATGNRKNSEFVQPQPVVRSFAVGFSPISVFFPVQRTEPANTSWQSSPVQWSPVLCRVQQWSPVESRFVLRVAVESSPVQSSPVLCRIQLTVQWSPGLC